MWHTSNKALLIDLSTGMGMIDYQYHVVRVSPSQQCVCVCVSVCAYCILYFVHVVVPVGIFPWEIRVAFPIEKPAATGSHYPTLIINYKLHAGSVRVSVIQ